MLVREDRPGRRTWSPTSCPPRQARRTPARCAAGSPRRLPDYMVPAAFVVARRAAAHPQRQAGPRPPCPRPTSPAGRRRRRPAPRASSCSCELFAEVLAVPEVGVDDDFFGSAATASSRSGWSAGPAPAGSVAKSRGRSSEQRTPAALAAAAEVGVRHHHRQRCAGRAHRRGDRASVARGLDVAEVLPLAPLQEGLLLPRRVRRRRPGRLHRPDRLRPVAARVDRRRLRAAGRCCWPGTPACGPRFTSWRSAARCG